MDAGVLQQVDGLTDGGCEVPVRFALQTHERGGQPLQFISDLRRGPLQLVRIPKEPTHEHFADTFLGLCRHCAGLWIQELRLLSAREQPLLNQGVNQVRSASAGQRVAECRLRASRFHFASDQVGESRGQTARVRQRSLTRGQDGCCRLVRGPDDFSATACNAFECALRDLAHQGGPFDAAEFGEGYAEALSLLL